MALLMMLDDVSINPYDFTDDFTYDSTADVGWCIINPYDFTDKY